MSYRILELFGGAIVATAPSSLIDASDLRQIPDNQEVFLYPNSDISIIVEILQSPDPQDPLDIARFHFDSLAHDNSATMASVSSVKVIPNDRGDDTPSPVVLTGVQSVSKFNRVTPDEVQILLAVFRVRSKRADLVVTFNVPTTPGGENSVQPKGQFDTFVESLRILNFNLFADPA